MHGFTENYVKVELPYDAALVNKTCKVRLLELNEDGSAVKVELL